VRVSPRRLLPFLILMLSQLAAAPVYARKHDTGFLDRTITVQGTTYKYQVFVPDDWNSHKKWPVILFLHGAGERGDDGLLETDVGIGPAIRNGRSRIPAIVVMPQCPKNLWWLHPPMQDLAMATLDAAIKEFAGDAQRTYLMGLSMGGYGCWRLAENNPGKFAAMIVICGGIRPPANALKAHPDLAKLSPPDDPKSYSDAAAKVGNVPVWIFHGAADDIVPVTESQRMYAAMKQVSSDAHFTEYPGVGHMSWVKAYDEPKLFPWLFSKSLATNPK
jgi:predicted peptidase